MSTSIYPITEEYRNTILYWNTVSDEAVIEFKDYVKTCFDVDFEFLRQKKLAGSSNFTQFFLVDSSGNEMNDVLNCGEDFANLKLFRLTDNELTMLLDDIKFAKTFIGVLDNVISDYDRLLAQ